MYRWLSTTYEASFRGLFKFVIRLDLHVCSKSYTLLLNGSYYYTDQSHGVAWQAKALLDTAWLGLVGQRCCGEARMTRQGQARPGGLWFGEVDRAVLGMVGLGAL